MFIGIDLNRHIVLGCGHGMEFANKKTNERSHIHHTRKRRLFSIAQLDSTLTIHHARPILPMQAFGNDACAIKGVRKHIPGTFCRCRWHYRSLSDHGFRLEIAFRVRLEYWYHMLTFGQKAVDNVHIAEKSVEPSPRGDVPNPATNLYPKNQRKHGRGVIELTCTATIRGGKGAGGDNVGYHHWASIRYRYSSRFVRARNG